MIILLPWNFQGTGKKFSQIHLVLTVNYPQRKGREVRRHSSQSREQWRWTSSLSRSTLSVLLIWVLCVLKLCMRLWQCYTFFLNINRTIVRWNFQARQASRTSKNCSRSSKRPPTDIIVVNVCRKLLRHAIIVCILYPCKDGQAIQKMSSSSERNGMDFCVSSQWWNVLRYEWLNNVTGRGRRIQWNSNGGW